MDLLNNAKSYPHWIIHSVVRLQAVVRLRIFAHAHDIPVNSTILSPPNPEVQLAMYLSRRLRNGPSMDVEKELLEVARLICSNQQPRLYDLSDLVQYCDKCGLCDLASVMLRERLNGVVVSMQEDLHSNLLAAGTDVNLMQQLITIRDAALPVALKTHLNFAHAILKRTVESLEAGFEQRLRRCMTVSDLEDLMPLSLQTLLPNSHIPNRIRLLAEQRRDFLRTAIQTLYEHPLPDGCVPDLEFAAVQYSLELGTTDPVLRQFVADVCMLFIRHKTGMENGFKVEDELMTFHWTDRLGPSFVVPLFKMNTTHTEFRDIVGKQIQRTVSRIGGAEGGGRRNQVIQLSRLLSTPSLSELEAKYATE